MRRRGPPGSRTAAATLAATGIGLVLAAGASAGAPRSPTGHADAPPPGRTGGFGEPTCRECHDEFELGVNGSFTAEGLPERYEPGRTYTVTLVLESAGMERAGFQAAVRFASGARKGASAGTVGAIGETVVVRRGEDGALFVQHAPGALWTDGEVASWSFAWTAPARADDPVALHAAANSANGDDSPFGDIVYALADSAWPDGLPPPEREDPWQR